VRTVECKCPIIRSRPKVSGLPAGDDRVVRGERSVSLKLEGFAWESVEQESLRQGVPVEELVTFAVLYYLADVDSGRVSRQISRSPYPDTPPADTPPADASA
jgi:hypothetical protein